MELNPNHGVTAEVREQWHKICAIIMHKLKQPALIITDKDIEDFIASGNTNIVAHPIDRTLKLMLVGDEEAKRLVAKHGGAAV